AAGAAALDRTALALGLQPPRLGRARGPGGDARLRRTQAGVDERVQAFARVLAVALLGAEALGLDHQHALVGQAPVAAGQQALAHRLGQRRRVGHVEAQLDRGRDLVDVLAAGAAGADEAFDDFAFGYLDVHGRRRHVAGMRARRLQS